MNFIWFWTFWHWSKESFRAGVFLREPLQGIGGHWDEWFRHEASAEEIHAIEMAGRTEASQRRFIAWLLSAARICGPITIEYAPGVSCVVKFTRSVCAFTAQAYAQRS